MDIATVVLSVAVGAAGVLGLQVLLAMKEMESSSRQSLVSLGELITVARESLTVIQSINMKTSANTPGSGEQLASTEQTQASLNHYSYCI